MGIREYLEIIGGIIAVILFLSPIICTLLKGRIMPAVHKAITDNNKELKKDFKYDLKQLEDNIISINRDVVKEEIKEKEIQDEKERQLRSATYVEKIDNMKAIMARNEERRKEDNESMFEILDSIKSEINNLSKLAVDHEGKIRDNKDRITSLEKSKK